MIKRLILLSLAFVVSCQNPNSLAFSDPNFPQALSPISETHFRMTDERLLELQKSRALDDWIGVEYFDKGSWVYSEIRNQGHKVREDLKPSFKWRVNLGVPSQLKTNLSGQSRDITMLRYALSSFLFKRGGLQVASMKFTNLFINGLWYGPYLNLELVDGVFLEKRATMGGALFKAQYRSELTLKNNVKMSQAFVQKWPAKSEADLNSIRRLEELASILDQGVVEDTLALSKILNIENALSYLAVSKLIHNKDGIRNNYYLYLNPQSKQFEFIPWDLDETFRGASVFKVYENNLFEQLEQRSDFSKRISEKMLDIWDENLLLKELGALKDSLGGYARNQNKHYQNAALEYDNDLNSITKFISDVSLQLDEMFSFVKN
jgi:hypothetical protein